MRACFRISTMVFRGNFCEANEPECRLRQPSRMSRAFVNEDACQWGNPGRRFDLPDRDDPGFDEAAAQAMLEAAREGDTGSAEMADGLRPGRREAQAIRARDALPAPVRKRRKDDPAGRALSALTSASESEQIHLLLRILRNLGCARTDAYAGSSSGDAAVSSPMSRRSAARSRRDRAWFVSPRPTYTMANATVFWSSVPPLFFIPSRMSSALWQSPVFAYT